MTELRYVNTRLGIPMAPRETEGDLGDVAARSEDRERDADARARYFARLREIEAALVRLSDGSYGECLDCGSAIAPARLQALPTVETCRGCQEKLEAAAAERTTRGFDTEEDE
jgi:DnaK suppressor protein